MLAALPGTAIFYLDYYYGNKTPVNRVKETLIERKARERAERFERSKQRLIREIREEQPFKCSHAGLVWVAERVCSCDPSDYHAVATAALAATAGDVRIYPRHAYGLIDAPHVDVLRSA